MLDLFNSIDADTLHGLQHAPLLAPELPDVDVQEMISRYEVSNKRECPPWAKRICTNREAWYMTVVSAAGMDPETAWLI